MCAIFGFTSPSLKKEQVLPYFEKTKSRGPDDTRLEPAGSGMLGFHRLAIMGLHPEGMQPFHRGGDMAVCNGELYGFSQGLRLRVRFRLRNYPSPVAGIRHRDVCRA